MVSRRDFLKTSTVAAGAALGSTVVAAPSKPIVGVGKGEAKIALQKAISAVGGIEKFVKPGYRVVLKPNIGFPNPPEWSTTTHPEVVVELTKMCQAAGASRVLILDHPLRDSQVCKAKTGVYDAVKDMKGVVFAMLDDKKFYKEVPIPKGQELSSTAVMKQILRADCYINLPTAKSHSATGYSGALKNNMGAIYERSAFHERLDMNRAIAELMYACKPHLTVIDVIYALLTRGPAGPGKTEQINTVVASADAVAADSYSVGLAKWYNRSFKGTQVKHLKIAHELGFGEIEESKMDIRFG